MDRKIIMLATFLSFLLIVNLTRADPNISNCTNIVESGTYYLINDINYSSLAVQCFNISVQNVTFDCQNHLIYGNRSGIGINIWNNSNKVKNCRLENWGYGIELDDLSGSRDVKYNTIDNVTLNYNTIGILFRGTDCSAIRVMYNNATNSVFYNNSQNGINTLCSSNLYFDFFWISNSYRGMHFDYSTAHTIKNSVIRNSQASNIYHNLGVGTQGLKISNVTTENAVVGMECDAGSPSNSNWEIENWTARNNSIGYRTVYCQNNRINHSFIVNNTRGLLIGLYSVTSFFDNLVNSTSRNVWLDPEIYLSVNYFNTTNKTGNRVFTYGQLGGNYWAYPNKTGFSDTCTDANTDGFCDSIYNISGSDKVVDFLPYANTLSPPPPPPANFTNLTITTNNALCGIFSPSLDTHTYPANSNVTISVYPLSCTFDYWYLSPTNSTINTTSFTLTMNQNYTAKCYFKNINVQNESETGGGISFPQEQAYANPFVSGYFVLTIILVAIASFTVYMTRNVLFGFAVFLAFFIVFLIFGSFPSVFYAILIFGFSAIVTTVVLTYITRGGLGREYLLLGFTIFVFVYFSISAMIGVNFITGQAFITKKPVCTSGFVIIDGLLECFWQYLQPFFALFDISTTLGILNSILLAFALIVGFIFISVARGS